MTYDEALEYIHSNFWQGSKPGLSRTAKLLNKMGNPQESLSFIHVAGTNGKGSFCTMLSSVLIEAGYKVGTYTSPFIMRFNERMRINNTDIPDDTLVSLTEYVLPFAESMEEKPTEFELITAIAFEYFKREKCNIVVLECGMGGRLDSTNVISSPVLSVITGIALDHTAFLGDTIEKIAFEKAGIIKENIPCLYCGNQKDVLKVINDVANSKNAMLYRVSDAKPNIKNFDLSGTVFDFEDFKDIRINLLGTYQIKNAQNVITAIKILRDLNFKIEDRAVFSGLTKAKWKARYEIISKNPLMLFDGGHNPQGIISAAESTKLYFKDKKLTVICGVMADKDYPFIAKTLSKIADKVFCVTPDNARALKACDFAKEFEKCGIKAFACDSILDAVSKAKQTENPIIALGSLYMYKEIFDCIN